MLDKIKTKYKLEPILISYYGAKCENRTHVPALRKQCSTTELIWPSSNQQTCFLCPLTSKPIPSALNSIKPRISRGQRIAIWTNQTKIIFKIIPPVTVNMVSDQRNLSGLYTNLSPVTQTTFITKLLSKISFNMVRNNT